MRRVAFWPLLLVACTASGSDDETHGPVYGSADAGGVTDASGDVAASPDAADGAPVPDTGSDAGAADAADAADAAPDSGADAAPVDAADAGSCAAVTVVLAGGASSLAGASAQGRGAFVVQALTGSLASAPALVPFGAGFQALLRQSTNTLGSLALSGTWGAVSPLPGSPQASDAPALAAVGAALHAVYLGTNDRYYHATFNGTAWDNGSDPVGLPDGGAQAFGPARASAAAVGSELVIAYQGNDGHLYAQSWTSGAWAPQGTAIGTDLLAASEPPALVALAGGTHDLLVVYESRADTKLYAAVRDATLKTWSTPAVVNANAFTHVAPSLAPMSGARAVLAWLGTDGFPYTSAYDAALGSWSAPAPLLASGNPATLSAPSLARGNCGDDAVAAYVSGGAVSVARLAGGAWSASPVSGLGGATFVTVATTP